DGESGTNLFAGERYFWGDADVRDFPATGGIRPHPAESAYCGFFFRDRSPRWLVPELHDQFPIAPPLSREDGSHYHRGGHCPLQTGAGRDDTRRFPRGLALSERVGREADPVT